jgi:hypothetical protein
MFLRGITMIKLLKILRLHYGNKLSNRQIEKTANCCKIFTFYYILCYNIYHSEYC